MNNIHSCSYSCDRPECIKAQRDELAAAAAQEAVAWINPDDLAESPRALVCRNSSRYLSGNERYTIPLYAAPVTAAPADLISGVLSDLAAVAGSWIVEAAGPSADALNDCAAKMLEAIEQQSIKYGLFDASTPAAPGIDLLGELVEAIKRYRLSASTTNRASIERLDDVLSRIDASHKGTLNELFGSAE